MRVQGLNEAAGRHQPVSDYEPRLMRAAHEFEAQMLKQLLKPLTAENQLTGAGNSTGILGEFASEALGKGLSEQGGFGIADCVLHQFSRSGNHPETGRVTVVRHLDTGIKDRQSLE